jgi:hypothetical protein
VIVASPAAPAQTAASAGTDALHALNNYWQAINNGDFQAAYGYLGPGQEAESTWVSAQQAAGIQSATFSGTATYVGSTTATVHVDSRLLAFRWASSVPLTGPPLRRRIATALVVL